MSLPQEEIEAIVRRVLARLRWEAAPGASQISSPSLPASSEIGSTVLHERVIALETLAPLRTNMGSIHIHPKAVVTPAAKDWLKQHGIQWLRTPPAVGEPNAPVSIFVGGSASWLPVVHRSVCSKQATVAGPSVDDATALREAQMRLRDGYSMAFLVVKAAHACCWQAARDEKLRPAVAGDGTQLNAILGEVPVNLILVSSRDWNSASAANAIQRLYRFMKTKEAR